MRGNVLVVEHDADLCELLAESIGACGYAVARAATAEAALEQVERSEPDVLITDLCLAGANGLELCERVLKRRPEVRVVVMTAFGSTESAIGAIRVGAYDFVTKPISPDVLAVTIERAVRDRELHAEVRRLRMRMTPAGQSSMAGDSAPMEELNDVIARVAGTDAPVLITGESGSGKELVARAIHDRSGRKGPFLAINCAAMPETLLESELFGHARGAFTDAHSARKGLFVEADGGTLFLDEIVEMPLGMQAKLLRALQERRVRPLGESREIPFDARLVAATNRDVDRDVAQGNFREDLYYRINVVNVSVPPLRARGSDVLLLAQLFLERAAARSRKPVTRINNAVAQRLFAYAWPGNVRELENCIERAVALATFDEITVADLPPNLSSDSVAWDPLQAEDTDELPTVAIVEGRYIKRVLNAVSGNKTLAAKILGFDRRTLYRKLARLTHDPDGGRDVEMAGNAAPSIAPIGPAFDA